MAIREAWTQPYGETRTFNNGVATRTFTQGRDGIRIVKQGKLRRVEVGSVEITGSERSFVLGAFTGRRVGEAVCGVVVIPCALVGTLIGGVIGAAIGAVDYRMRDGLDQPMGLRDRVPTAWFGGMEVGSAVVSKVGEPVMNFGPTPFSLAGGGIGWALGRRSGLS